MITGQKKIDLTPELVLSKISEYDIFRFYMPDKTWKINTPCISPFPRRNGGTENHPSFMIGNKRGYLYFIDFADSDKRGGCFDFVQMICNLCSLNDVLVKIDLDFGLGILPTHKPIGAYKKIVAEYHQPEELGKRYALIQVVPRKFTTEELAYWNQFGQSLEDLRREHIYSLKEVYLNRSRFVIPDSELRFGYLYDGHWKIYRPYSSRKQKWMPNNVPITAMDGRKDILNCHTAFINKSKKDYMVVKKIFPTTCAVQNEGIACFSPENVDYIRSNSTRQLLSFDSDIPGVQNSIQITDLLGFGYMNVPRQYLQEGIKDWADLVRVHGMGTLERIFREKGLI